MRAAHWRGRARRAAPRCAPGPTVPAAPTGRAQQHVGGDYGKQQQAYRERERRDFVTADTVRSAEDQFVKREPRRLLGADVNRKANGNSQRESAEPRTSKAPAPPDRVRHAPSPLLAPPSPDPSVNPRKWVEN